MKHKIILTTLLFFLALAVKAQPLTFKTDSLKFGLSHIVQNEEGTVDTVNCNRNHYFIWFDESTQAGKELNNQLYGLVNEKNIGSLEELKAIMTEDFNDWAVGWNEQFEAEDSSPINYSFGLNWYEENNNGLSHQTPNNICLYQSINGYYGGAHPMGGVAYMVYSLPDISPVKNWQSLFTDTLAILKIAEEIFRKDNKLGPRTSLEKAGYWFSDNKFHLNDNFGLDAEGLFFYFNAYEIAPYAMGPTDVSLPYSRINKYLKKPL
ncbi:MAG: DUF3298 domain-containing protein [Sphingomonadales bacterium]|nr:DUF3298 domain-containing protein [Sphingomonadales bacterium]